MSQTESERGIIRSLRAFACRIPTDAPEADGTAAWDSTTVVLAQARAGSVTGVGWTYGPAACAGLVEELLAPVVVGRRVFDVTGSWSAMVRAVRNSTRAGAAGYAISAVDVALWDLKARVLGVSLADLFGAVRTEMPVYGSGGFTSYADDTMTDQLRHWAVTQRIPRVKIKVGQSRGAIVDRDIERIRKARKAIGDETELMIDANGAYGVKQAIALAHSVESSRVTWFEEPVSSDDLAGLGQVRAAVAAEVTAGEYGTDIGYFRRMVAAESVDCLQIDATRCGGYTEWFRSAAVAAAYERDVSAHCAPNLHAPAAAATINARHVEWFHDHVRIESMLFDGARDPTGGTIGVREGLGHGLTLRESVAEQYRTTG